MKLFGWGYVKETCISLFQKEQEQKIVNLYFAECLRIITENTAKACGGQYIQAKLQDIMTNKKERKYKEGEVKNKIKSKLRG